MALETPSRPPPLMANAILNFHFDFLTPSLKCLQITCDLCAGKYQTLKRSNGNIDIVFAIHAFKWELVDEVSLWPNSITQYFVVYYTTGIKTAFHF